MASPPPIKPPRTAKHGRETSGLLMSVIRTLSASETNEQRDREKAKLEKEYKKCDQKLDELVSSNDEQLTQVMQIFGSVCGVVGACRARIHGVRARLAGCKQLLRWRRADLRRLCSETAQHRHVLILLNQIEQLTGVGAEMSTHLLKKHYLNAAVVLQGALVTAQTDLCKVEALMHLREDLEIKRQGLYDRILGQVNLALYQINTDDISLKRQGSARRPELPRLISVQSEDGMFDITPQFEIDLTDDNKTLKINLFILVEAVAVIKNVRECSESIKVHMQTELLNVISRTSQHVLDYGYTQLPLVNNHPNADAISTESEISKKSDQEAQSAQPLVELIGLLLNQWRIIAERHEMLLDIWKHIIKKYNIHGLNVYTMHNYWSRVQAVLQLLLTDYLDIQSLKAGTQRLVYPEQPINADINSFFVKKKQQSKKKVRLFKFSGSAVETTSPTVERTDGAAAAGYKLVCTPAPEHLTHIYHLLNDFMEEIEKNTGLPECSLRVYLGELIRGAQGERAAAQLLEQITEFCSEPGAWRELTIIPLTSTKNKSLFKCGVQSWEACAHALAGWVRLGDLGARAARSAIAPALGALATAAKRRATYLAPRARSHAWRTDIDITRFLKSLPNWTLLKNPPVKGKKETDIDIEDIQKSFEREAEILGSSLGDGSVSEKEIISSIPTLRDIAIMCETMEWLFVKLNSWRTNNKVHVSNDSKINGVTSSPGSNKMKNSGSFDALMAELAHTASVFEEISDNCLLLLHLEVRMQCFHYLGKLGSSLGLTANAPSITSSTHIVPESPATSLARTLHSFSEHVAPVLNHRRLNYIMEGLGEMMSAVIVGSWRVGGSCSVGSVAAQLEPLRHCLTAAQISPDGLHKAALYLQMLTMTPEEILTMVSEKGAIFSELEYMNAFQVIAKTTNQPDFVLKANLNKLSNILGHVGVTV